MTNKQPEALPSLYEITGNITDHNTVLVSLAEIETLRMGYKAARLEIESLRKEHADELAVAYMCGASREKELAAPQPVEREPLTADEQDGLYWRLHSLSKSLEGRGRIDEYDTPDAYRTILDAMNALRDKKGGQHGTE